MSAGNTWEQVIEVKKGEYVFVEEGLAKLAPIIGTSPGNIMLSAEDADEHDNSTVILDLTIYLLCSMLQLQHLSFQKVQRLPQLVYALLDLGNIIIVNISCAVYTNGDLIDVIGYIACQFVDLMKFIFVHLNDVTLENHRSHKSAEAIHTAVLKLLLPSLPL